MKTREAALDHALSKGKRCSPELEEVTTTTFLKSWLLSSWLGIGHLMIANHLELPPKRSKPFVILSP